MDCLQFLQRQQREGPWIPRFWRLSAIKIFLCINNQQKELILGGLFESQIFAQQRDFGGALWGNKSAMYPSLTVKPEVSHPYSSNASRLQGAQPAKAM